MSGGMDDVFEEDDFPQTHASPASAGGLAVVQLAQAPVPMARKGSASHQSEDFPFQVENPGPRELLPATSIYNLPPNRKGSNGGPKTRPWPPS